MASWSSMVVRQPHDEEIMEKSSMSFSRRKSNCILEFSKKCMNSVQCRFMILPLGSPSSQQRL